MPEYRESAFPGLWKRLNNKAATAPTICPMTVAIAAPRIPIAGQPSRPKIIACYKRKRRENAGKNASITFPMGFGVPDHLSPA